MPPAHPLLRLLPPLLLFLLRAAHGAAPHPNASWAGPRYNLTTDYRRCRPAAIAANTFVPVFILTRDRVSTTQATLGSYRRALGTPWEPIVLDHHSTYPPMLEYLAALRAQGVPVLALNATSFDGALSKAAAHIAAYLAAHPTVRHYVVTDPDIQLAHSQPDLLLFLAALLDACPRIVAAGPALRVTDIPDHYKWRTQVVEHEMNFWNHVHFVAVWRGLAYNFVRAMVDTTFAMRRAATPFWRLPPDSVRTLAPYMATHSDWYLDLQRLPADYLWYRAHQTPGVNHWGSSRVKGLDAKRFRQKKLWKGG